jgi:hypothetical protein
MDTINAVPFPNTLTSPETGGFSPEIPANPIVF